MRLGLHKHRNSRSQSNHYSPKLDQELDQMNLMGSEIIFPRGSFGSTYLYYFDSSETACSLVVQPGPVARTMLQQYKFQS